MIYEIGKIDHTNNFIALLLFFAGRHRSYQESILHERRR